jgi:hypothetical protein
MRFIAGLKLSPQFTRPGAATSCRKPRRNTVASAPPGRAGCTAGVDRKLVVGSGTFCFERRRGRANPAGISHGAGFYTLTGQLYFGKNAMTTLGQRLLNADAAKRSNGMYTPEQVAAREAERVEAVRASFARVTEKAKADITKAVNKGHAIGDIKSQVPASEEAYRHLSHNKMRFMEYDRPLHQVVQPVWDAFLAWAASEQLEIWLQGCTQGQGSDARQYVLIKARPRLAH